MSKGSISPIRLTTAPKMESLSQRQQCLLARPQIKEILGELPQIAAYLQQVCPLSE